MFNAQLRWPDSPTTIQLADGVALRITADPDADDSDCTWPPRIALDFDFACQNDHLDRLILTLSRRLGEAQVHALVNALAGAWKRSELAAMDRGWHRGIENEEAP